MTIFNCVTDKRHRVVKEREEKTKEKQEISIHNGQDITIHDARHAPRRKKDLNKVEPMTSKPSSFMTPVIDPEYEFPSHDGRAVIKDDAQTPHSNSFYGSFQHALLPFCTT